MELSLGLKQIDIGIKEDNIEYMQGGIYNITKIAKSLDAVKLCLGKERYISLKNAISLNPEILDKMITLIFNDKEDFLWN